MVFAMTLAICSIQNQNKSYCALDKMKILFGDTVEFYVETRMGNENEVNQRLFPGCSVYPNKDFTRNLCQNRRNCGHQKIETVESPFNF